MSQPEPPSLSSEECHRLIAHLRHELRTALTAVIGYSEDLLETADGSEAMQLELVALRGAGTKVLSFINECLSVDTLRDLTSDGLLRLIRELGITCAEPAGAIAPLCVRLVAVAEAEGLYARIPTLCRIQAAGMMLNDLLAQYALELPRHAPSVGDLRVDSNSPSTVTIGEPSSVDRGRILIVDDNSVTRDVLAQWLTRHGYDVGEASGGDMALDLLATNDYDVILLDLIMPDRSGIEVLDVLKAKGQIGRTPVIMISAIDEVDGVAQALECGADDYVTKPFHMVLLRARIRMALELRRHRERERAYQQMLAEIGSTSNRPA
jgi:adenylate cyclase